MAEVRSESDEVAHFSAEGIRYAGKIIEPDTYTAGLDAPDVRFRAPNHKGELLLRKPLLFPTGAHSAAE